MAAIFYFSSRGRFEIAGENLADFVIFKTLHMIEYGFLYYLLLRAFYRNRISQISYTTCMKYAFVIAFFYGVIDEIHQATVPTREGKIRDMLIDTLGIFLVYLYSKYRTSFVSYLS